MKKINRRLGLIFCFLFLVGNGSLYAKTQPKFSFEPLTPTSIELSTDQSYTIQYRLTNQTPTERAVVMKPMAGLTQTTTGTNACLNPAILSPNANCILTLVVEPSTTPSTIVGGPEVCSVTPGTERDPDVFFCSQPSMVNTLAIQRIAATTVPLLQIEPPVLSLETGGMTGIIYVTNPSRTVTATHIQANLAGTPLQDTVIQETAGCEQVGPQSTCMLVFTSKNTAVSLTSFPIQGDNTGMAEGKLRIKAADVSPIKIEDSPLILVAGSSGHLTVRNESSTITANYIEARLAGTALEAAGVVQNSDDCISVLPGKSCTLTFTATQTTVVETQVPVVGTNTSLTSAYIGVNPAYTILEITNGSPLTLRADGVSQGTMTIKNVGNTAAVDVMAHFEGTALNGAVNASSCATIAPNGGTCTMTFTAGTTDVPSTGFPIYSTTLADTVKGILTLLPRPRMYGSSGFQTPSYVQLCAINTNVNSVGYGNPMDCIDSGIPVSLLSNPYAVCVRGEMFYTVNHTNASVTQCHIRTNTGGLEDCLSTSFSQYAINPVSVVVNYQRTMAYIGSRNHSRLTVCPVDTKTGLISNQECTNYSMPYPAGLTINQSDTVLYISNDGNHTVTACRLESNGQPNFSACQVTELWTTYGVDQPIGITLNPSESYIYLADANYGGLLRCPLGDDGFINASCFKQFVSSIEMFRTRGLTMNSAGTILYVASSESNPGKGVSQFSVDQTTGALTFVSNNFGLNSIYGLGLFSD